jgi:hypothetical protein
LYCPCVISGLRRDVDEICALVGYHLAYNGSFLLTFRNNQSKKIFFGLLSIYLSLHLSAFPFVHRLMVFGRHICWFTVTSHFKFLYFIILSASPPPPPPLYFGSSSSSPFFWSPGHNLLNNELSCTCTTRAYQFNIYFLFYLNCFFTSIYFLTLNFLLLVVWMFLQLLSKNPFQHLTVIIFTNTYFKIFYHQNTFR